MYSKQSRMRRVRDFRAQWLLISTNKILKKKVITIQTLEIEFFRRPENRIMFEYTSKLFVCDFFTFFNPFYSILEKPPQVSGRVTRINVSYFFFLFC